MILSPKLVAKLQEAGCNTWSILPTLEWLYSKGYWIEVTLSGGPPYNEFLVRVAKIGKSFTIYEGMDYFTPLEAYEAGIEEVLFHIQHE